MILCFLGNIGTNIYSWIETQFFFSLFFFRTHQGRNKMGKAADGARRRQEKRAKSKGPGAGAGSLQQSESSHPGASNQGNSSLPSWRTAPMPRFMRMVLSASTILILVSIAIHPSHGMLHNTSKSKQSICWESWYSNLKLTVCFLHGCFCQRSPILTHAIIFMLDRHYPFRIARGIPRWP